MKNIFFKNIVRVLLLLMISSVSYATPVQQLTSLLGGFTSYKANFKQWVVDDQQQLQSESNGVFEIKRPNKFRWLTKAPNNTLIIANGNTLWHYDVDLQQATQQVLKPGSQAENPAMLLSSKVSDLSSTFSVSSVKLQGKDWFLLKPKETQNYKRIYLYFDKGQLTKIIVINNLGDRSLFDFSNIVMNHTIPDSDFVFNTPKGVDLDVQK
jgi:outer membrane lipoprotein carrier protein